MNNIWNFNNSYLELPEIFYSNTRPEKFQDLNVIIKNENLLNNLDLNKEIFERLIIDTINNKNNKYFSQAYAGHQFGHFTILGDGRA